MLVACLTSLVAINGKNHVGTGIPQLLPLRSRWNVPKTTLLAPLLVELYSGEPALTRDAGCRSASLVWTCAQLHYLTKRQQRNVDNETTYKTSAMKQPKRSGLAWSHGRDAALLRAVSSRSSTTGTWWSLASALPCLQGLQYRTQCASAWQLASIEA